MTLYTKDGSVPAELPFRIFVNGRSRTDPSSFTADEIAAAGYVEAPAKPTHDPNIEDLGWDGSNWAKEPKPRPTSTQINAERDRRITAGFSLDGNTFDFDPTSKQRVTGAATLAKFAVLAGAQKGDLRWINPDADFSWIAQDNSLVTMDAQTCSSLGDAAAIHEQMHVFAARALKDANPVPYDYTDDKYWP